MATIIAASRSSTDVQAAINLAVTDDTVVVPAGSSVKWEVPVTIPSTKKITLSGVGATIEDGVEDGGALEITVASGPLTRVTGFTFNANGITKTSTHATIEVDGAGIDAFRIDNNVFNNLRYRGIKVIMGGNELAGVIDHNTFNAPFDAGVQGIAVFGAGPQNSAPFARPLELGSGKFIFAEDNVFDYAYQNDGVVEGYGGARYVMRHNTIHGGTQGSHGADSGNYRGTHSYEIYDNTFDQVGSVTPNTRRKISLRSGTGVIYNNSWSSDYGLAHLRNLRSCGSYGVWGTADGNNPIDGNTPGGQGYPALDQIGHVFTNVLDGTNTFEPLYCWNNTHGGSPTGFLVLDTCVRQTDFHIIENRDFYNSTVRPGYTAYAYPHPLTLGGVTLATLTHGTMLGAVEDTKIKVWTRTSIAASILVQYQLAGGSWASPFLSASAATSSVNDFTHQFQLTGLTPNTLYDYRISLDGVPQAASTFRTSPSVGSPCAFSFVFGADIREDYQPNNIFDQLLAKNPHLFIELGDHFYNDAAATPPAATTEAGFWGKYKTSFDAKYLGMMKRVPVFAVWDDHDYGADNQDSTYPYRAASRAAYGKYWPNPDYVESNGSVHFKFQVGDTEFFMLDCRYNKITASSGHTMLGVTQLAWLKAQLLASSATFKFVLSSVLVADYADFVTDSWEGFAAERDGIFAYIAANNIRNVSFLSGDTHWSAAFLINYPVSQISNVTGFYEFECTPLNAIATTPPSSSDPEILFKQGTYQHYAVISVDTTQATRQFTVEYRRGDTDAVVYSIAVPEFSRKRIAFR